MNSRVFIRQSNRSLFTHALIQPKKSHTDDVALHRASDWLLLDLEFSRVSNNQSEITTRIFEELRHQYRIFWVEI